jgi:hypothetical protein
LAALHGDQLYFFLLKTHSQTTFINYK